MLAAILLAGGMTGRAHHSFTATYDESKSMTVEGKLVQFLFRNPHSFVHVMAPDEKGQVQRWAVEWGGAGQLGAQGVTRETLKPGDIVAIPDGTRPITGYAWSRFGERRTDSDGVRDRAKRSTDSAPAEEGSPLYN